MVGDTKVVPREAAAGLFINTSGVDELVDPVPRGPQVMGWIRASEEGSTIPGK